MLKNSKIAIHLEIESIKESPYDCECCGTCWPEKTLIKANNEVIWFKEFDGHFGANQSEEPLEVCVLNFLKTKWIEKIQEQYTEEARLRYDKSFPLSSVAKTQQSWESDKALSLKYCIDGLDNILSTLSKSPAPYDLKAKLMLIEVWVYEEFQEEVSFSIKEN